MVTDHDGSARPRVLIAGGGFVGMYTALSLERQLTADEADLELVAPENFMCYQPLLPEVASGSVEPRHVVLPLRQVLRRTRVTQGRLTGLDQAARRATVEPIDGATRQLDYDLLVLGLGSVTRLLPVPGLVERAVGFSTLTEAIHLRNHVLARLETAEASVEPSTRQAALTFVLVGGGYAGVEALAELQDLARDALEHYRTLDPRDMRWILIEATDRILRSMDQRPVERTMALLRGRGIEIRLNTRLESAHEGVMHLSDGEVLRADTLVWMPGVVPNPVTGRLGLPRDDAGRLCVDAHLRVRGAGEIWAAGDCAAVPDADGRPQPPTAQHAQRQARHLAENLVRVLHRQPTRPFHYRACGEFVTLGNHRAVAQIMRFQLHGMPAWLLRRGYYLARIPSSRRRLHLLIDWLVSLPFERDIVQLGSAQDPGQPLREAHAESHSA